MRLSFDSVDEVKEFVKQLKGTRGGKGDKDDDAGSAETKSAPSTGTAPAPIMPPQTTQAGFPGGAQGFAPPAGGAATPGAFPVAAAPQIAPEVAAWVAKISGVIDATASTDRAPAMLNWFRQSCGTEAANASFEQIKSHFLPKFNAQQLADMGKLMGLT